jgi:hypothetical protein
VGWVGYKYGLIIEASSFFFLPLIPSPHLHSSPSSPSPFPSFVVVLRRQRRRRRRRKQNAWRCRRNRRWRCHFKHIMGDCHGFGTFAFSPASDRNIPLMIFFSLLVCGLWWYSLRVCYSSSFFTRPPSLYPNILTSVHSPVHLSRRQV